MSRGDSWRPGSVLVLGLAVATITASAQGLALVPGVPIERPLAAGGVERFAVEMAAGSHWQVRVEQLGIDVVVAVEDPRGETLFSVNSPLGREGTESLLLTPTLGGSYVVEVRRDQQNVPPGRYRIGIEKLPAVTAEDRLRLRAEEGVTDAGRLYHDRGASFREQALVRLRDAVETWETLGDVRRQAETLLAIGGVLEDLDDYRQAVSSYERALALWRRLGDDEGVVAALDLAGAGYEHLGDNPRAISVLEEALDLRRALGQRGREATTRNNLCLGLQRSGRWTEAGECYRKALELAKELDDTELEAVVLNNLGGIDSNLGEPATALAYFEQARELRRTLGDEQGEAATLNNLGALHHGLGEVEDALLCYDSALQIFRRLGNRYWQARTLNNLGFSYLALGELERARSVLLEALPLRQELGDRLGEAVTLRNLGRASAQLGQPVRALAFYRRALDSSLAVDDRRGAATARKLLGELHATQHRPAEARTELELALSSLQQMGKRPEEAEVLELLSRVHRELGEAVVAKDLATRALAIERAVRNPLGAVAALTALARAERALDDTTQARRHLEDALSELETLQGGLGDASRRASFLASQRQVYELYVDLLMELHRREPGRGHDLEALAASERARSRALLALLESAGAGLERGVEPRLRERLRAAERRFTAKTQRQLQVFSGTASKEEILTAEQELYAALAELDNVRAEIRRQNPHVASLSATSGASPTLDATAIRGLLDDDTVLLEFLLGEERSFLWWVTPTAVESYTLPPRAIIEALAERTVEEVSAIHRRSAKTQEAVDDLGRMLLGPVADRLRDQRLVIVADGALHLVPFAALTLPAGQQREPVLVRHEVVNLPSASVLDTQRHESPRHEPPRPSTTHKPTASKTVAILADPIFDASDERIHETATEPAKPTIAERVAATASSTATDRDRGGLDDLVRLPETRREAEAIAALVPEDQRLLDLDGAARRSRVVDDELCGYRILHFATHGLINPRIPELSGLMLSRFDAQGAPLDGFLGLHDVANLELSADLVVLSGCRTALGKQVRGEGLVGLARGFMYAGVPRVVASLWQVRDQATAELMARFYRAMLVDDLPPAAALRAAQLSLRQERRWRDPYYWAAFELQGDWR